MLYRRGMLAPTQQHRHTSLLAPANGISIEQRMTSPMAWPLAVSQAALWGLVQALKLQLWDALDLLPSAQPSMHICGQAIKTCN